MTPVRQTIFVADHPNGWGNCMSAAIASILDRPLSEVIDTTDPAVRDAGFWKSIYRWFNDQGLKLVDYEPGAEELEGRYSIGTGQSPRGNFHHAVICKSGRVVWDPHPSDDGVTSLINHQVVEPMTDVEKRRHAARCAAEVA